MKALNKKLWRDLWKTKGQAMAIVMVVASGIATFVMLRSAMHTLELTQKKFYIESGFSDIFASLKRTPES
jgi:putative ABC transport system permease protein